MKSKFLLIAKVFCVIVALCVTGNALKAQTYVTIGTGSLTNSAVTYPAPYGNFFYGARHQFLILASELSSAGILSNSVISQIGFNVQTPAPAPLTGFSISMAPTAATTLTTTFITAGMTQMFDPMTYTTTTGWNTHTFTNGGFVWDGTSNIVVDVCFNNNTWTQNAISYYSTTASTRCSYRFADAMGNCNDPGFQVNAARPNMRLTIGGVNLPPPIAPLANFQFVLGVDTLWERSPSILTNTSTYQDKSYWDITGYNDDSTNGVWDPFFTVRQPNAWGTWIDTANNKTNFNFKFPLPGYYRIKLLCVNTFGVSSIEKVVFVATPTVKPTAYFFANKTKTGVGDQIQFYDASSNGPIGWSWWIDPPCITCGQFFNEFFPSADLPRPVLNANEGGTFKVCMAVWNDIGGDTVCRNQYVNIIDGFQMCNGTDSVTKSVEGYVFPPFFQTYSSLYYNVQTCPSTGFRLAPCADTIYINIERLKMRTQDSVHIRTGSFNGPIIRRVGGNNLAGLHDTIKNFKYVGQELFIRYIPGAPNNPAWVNDSGFAIKWRIAPATFPAPAASFTCLDTVYSGYKMTFTNTTPGVNIAYAWDLNGDNIFGMDNPIFPDSVTNSPSYTFFSFVQTTRNVCLRATNCKGKTTTCKQVVLLPIAVAPVADFTVNANTGFTTDVFKFKDISQYGASQWKWSFNPASVTYQPGFSDASQYPEVKFNVAQTYDVTLTATNPFGSTSITKTAYITTLSYSNPGSIYPPQSSDMDVGITRVKMDGTTGKIDTITPLKDAAYRSYYLSSNAVVYRGASYKVEVSRESANDAQNFRAWIDWNRNTSYTDPGETILTEDGQKKVMTSFEFTVPNDANLGLSRMLIGVCPEYSTITPSIATLGVYEDHGITVGEDKTKPVVTLQGDEVLHIELGRPFVDPGATAWDNIEKDISSRIVMSGNVDINKLGYYKIKYYVTDYYGNVSDTVYRLVQNEVSTVPPTLTLTPPDTVTIEVYNTFNEPGYVAVDNRSNVITSYVVRTNLPDTTKLGTYTVTYKVSDAFGNSATAKRVVRVRDTTKPIISSRIGRDTIVHELKTPFEDNDYIKVTDNYWKNLSYTRTGILNVNKRGLYYLQYQSVDGSGNISDVKGIFVRVKNTHPPVVVLNGEPDVLIQVFGSYSEQGATARDFEGTPLEVDIIDSALDVNNVKDYPIYYIAKDQDENTAFVIRTVRVRDTKAPEISLIGADPLYWPLDTQYVDPGIKVSDNYWTVADIDTFVNIKGVNWRKEGHYYVYYDAKDKSGNVAAQKNRLVIVKKDVPQAVNEVLQIEAVVYPNPANQLLNIDLISENIKSVTIYDMQGKALSLTPASMGNHKYLFDISKEQAGMYLIRIETAAGAMINSKFTIVR